MNYLDSLNTEHRIEAHTLLDRKEIPAEIIQVKSRAELISLAYKANTGGALPPTKADTEHTVSMLHQQGMSVKAIADLIGLPAGLTREFVNQIKSKTHRISLQKAMHAVTEGNITAAKAAENYGIDLEKLKEALGAKKKKRRNGIGELHTSLARQYQAFSRRHNTLWKGMFDKFEDGDVTSKQVLEIFEHLEKLQKGLQRNLADYKTRFQAKCENTKAAGA
jgi:hypothetical protein